MRRSLKPTDRRPVDQRSKIENTQRNYTTHSFTSNPATDFMRAIQQVLNTKMDEFMTLSSEELNRRKMLIQEYITLIVSNVENYPAEFEYNQVRRTEICSMRTLSEVFQHRIDEMGQNEWKNVA